MKFFQNRQNTEIAIGSVIVFVFKLSGIATTYIFTLLISRYYGANVLGIFSLSLTLLMLFNMISKMGLDTVALKHIAQYKSENNIEQIGSIYWRSWKLIFTFSLVASIVFFSAASFFSYYILQKPEMTINLRIISLAIVPMALCSLNQESLRAIKKLGYYSFFINQSLYLFSLIVLALALTTNFNTTSTAPVIAVSLGIFLTWIYSQVIWQIHSGTKIACLIDIVLPLISTKDLLKLGRPLLLANSMNFLLLWTDTLVIGLLCPVDDLGVYTTCVKLTNFVNIPFLVINSLAAPMIAEYYSTNRTVELKLLIRKFRYLMTFGTVVFGGIILVFRFEALELFGPQFVAGVSVLQTLILAKLVSAVAGPIGLVMQMTGREVIFKNIMFIAVFTNVTLNFILVPLIGVIGAASATVFSIMLMNVLAVTACRT